MLRARTLSLLALLATPAGATLVSAPPMEPAPDGGASVLCRVDQATLLPDGAQQSRWYRLVRAGKDGFGEEPRLWFLGQGSEVRVPLARIWRGGSARPVGASLRSRAAAPGARPELELALDLGPVTPGDLLEVVLERRVASALEGLDFAPSHSFGGPRPVGREVFEVRVPPGRGLRYLARGLGARSEPERRQEGGFEVYRWRVDRPRPDRAAPAQRPYVRTTRLESWSQVAAWYAPRLAARRQPSPRLQVLAGELAAGEQDPGRVLARLLDHVASRIPYGHSLQGTDADLCGRPAEVVLRRGQGNCVDKANLLAALLAARGLAARPVLTTDDRSRPLDPEVPSFLPGDHALLRVDLPAGPVLVDPTAPGYRPGQLPPRLRRRVVWDPASGEFLATPGATPGGDQVDRHFQGTLDSQGTLRGHLRVRLGGEPEAAARRRMLAGRDPARLEALFVPPGARVLARDASAPEDLTAPLELGFTLELAVPRLAPGRLLLRPPLAPLEVTRSDDELAPRWLERVEVVLPAGWRVPETAGTQVLRDLAGELQSGWTAGGGRLHFVSQLQVSGGDPPGGLVEARRQVLARALELVYDPGPRAAAP